MCIRGRFINARVFSSEIWGLVERVLVNNLHSEGIMPEIKRLQIFKEVLSIIICCEKKNVNAICLPTEHQGAQRTRSEVAVQDQIGS